MEAATPRGVGASNTYVICGSDGQIQNALGDIRAGTDRVLCPLAGRAYRMFFTAQPSPAMLDRI
jgi:hypothetical protein